MTRKQKWHLAGVQGCIGQAGKSKDLSGSQVPTIYFTNNISLNIYGNLKGSYHYPCLKDQDIENVM